MHTSEYRVLGVCLLALTTIGLWRVAASMIGKNGEGWPIQSTL